MVRINQTRSEGTDGDDFERWLADMRGLLWETQRGGGTWESFAASVNLSPGTVARFASGETKSPHGRTLFALMQACGHRLPVVPVKAGPVPGEFTLSAQQRRAQARRLAEPGKVKR